MFDGNERTNDKKWIEENNWRDKRKSNWEIKNQFKQEECILFLFWKKENPPLSKVFCPFIIFLECNKTKQKTYNKILLKKPKNLLDKIWWFYDRTASIIYIFTIIIIKIPSLLHTHTPYRRVNILFFHKFKSFPTTARSNWNFIISLECAVNLCDSGRNSKFREQKFVSNVFMPYDEKNKNQFYLNN